MKLAITTWIFIHLTVLEYYKKCSFICGNIYSQDGKRFRCPLDPLTDRYPDPTDPSCVHYFLCHLGHAFPRRCDVRRAFHPVLKECYPRYQIPEDLCSLPVDCDYNGYMVDPEDCTKYYICFFHQAIHYACLTNHYFDPKKSLCIKDAKKAESCAKPKQLNGPNPKQDVFQRGNYDSSKRQASSADTATAPYNPAPATAPQLENSEAVLPDKASYPAPSTMDVEDVQTEQNDDTTGGQKTRRQAVKANLNEPSSLLVADYN